MPQAEPLVFVRDGNGWVGEGATTRGDFPSRDVYARARQWWERLRAQSAHGDELVAFGAFPFAPDSPGGATLLVPERAERVTGGRLLGSGRLPGGGAIADGVPSATIRDGLMSREAYTAGVARIAAAIGAGELQKAVLARDVLVSPSEPVDRGALVDRLLLAHPGAAVYAVDGLIGASPETLVTVHDGVVTARVLAGTAGPGSGDALLGSGKDLREHELAARSVLEALAPHLRSVTASGPFILSLPHLAHLATDVTGTIADGSDVLALVEALHPTAAVAGTPTDAALAMIRSIEPGDRGRYAGPVGWMDAAGDGEWAIALRGAQARADGTFHAFAGAGIMADSDPSAELAETELKLRPILDALGAP